MDHGFRRKRQEYPHCSGQEERTPISRLGIVPTADQMQTDMVWNPLAEQIEHGWDESLPKSLPNPDDLYRLTLIGAWAEDRLIGGAFEPA